MVAFTPQLQRKVNRQVNRPRGPKAHPNHLSALAQAKLRPRVRVMPVNEAQRHVLQHPDGMAFRHEGSAEWPFDRFTQRRIRDGAIRIVEVITVEQQQARREALAAAKASPAAPAETPAETRRHSSTHRAPLRGE